MNFADKGAAALILALALAGCGGGSDEAADTSAPVDTATAGAVPADTATTAATPTPAATDTATPAPTASPSATATPSPTPSATPKPTPSASPSAKPSTVAVARPAEFAQCSACHSVEPGKHGLGPSLAGGFGDKAGTQAGYNYSDAMKSSGLTWNAANLDRFLADPRGVVPGTKMAYPGLKDAAKRQAVIAYLRTL